MHKGGEPAHRLPGGVPQKLKFPLVRGFLGVSLLRRRRLDAYEPLNRLAPATAARPRRTTAMDHPRSLRGTQCHAGPQLVTPGRLANGDAVLDTATPFERERVKRRWARTAKPSWDRGPSRDLGASQSQFQSWRGAAASHRHPPPPRLWRRHQVELAERARSCRNALTMADVMVDEIRLRAHARPFDQGDT